MTDALVESQCPRCGAAVLVEPQRPVCPACGFAGPAAAAPLPSSLGAPLAPPPPPSSALPPRPTFPMEPPTAPQDAHGQAVAALVLGILAVFVWPLGLVLGTLALVFGIRALGRLAGRRDGDRGMAVAGVATGSVGLGFGVLFILVTLFVFALGGDGGPDKLGPGSCEDEHLRATLAAVERRAGGFEVRLDLESRDRFGAIDLTPEGDGGLRIATRNGTFVLRTLEEAPPLDANATRSYGFSGDATHEVVEPGDPWRSFALVYEVRDGHDRGEAEGLHTLRCSLDGDDLPEALL